MRGPDPVDCDDPDLRIRLRRQAAMTVERAQTYARVARTVETVNPVIDPNRVWYGGCWIPSPWKFRLPLRNARLPRSPRRPRVPAGGRALGRNL